MSNEPSSSDDEERFPGAMLGVSILALTMAIAFFGAAALYISRL